MPEVHIGRCQVGDTFVPLSVCKQTLAGQWIAQKIVVADEVGNLLFEIAG